MNKSNKVKLIGAIRRKIAMDKVRGVSPAVLDDWLYSIEHLIDYCLSLKTMKPNELEQFIKRSKRE